jgi:hypothetical protein
MRIRLLALLLFVACATTASAQTATAWNDVTRDVYIDGEMDRSAQVLSAESPSRYALISSRLDRAYVLDVSGGTVSAIPKDAFRFYADGAKARLDTGVQPQAAGKFTRVDGPAYVFAVGGKPVIIRPHPGVTGEMTPEKLWEAVPIWRAQMESYHPSRQAVEALKSDERDATITLVYGTWCPDSKNYVPKIIKAIEAAANSRLKVKLIGVDNQFREPVDTVQPRAITNVPTVIVERDGREIGRIVETPAAATIEEDLAAILSGKPLAHQGRWDRGPRLASGVYSYRDRGGKERGSESWDLFSTAEGGYLLHSRITAGEMTTEVFYRVDARRRPTFVEVTKQRGDERVRVRHNVDARTLTARARGNNAGVISQTLEVPDALLLITQAVAPQGWLPEPVSGGRPLTSYTAPGDFDSPVGALAATVVEARNEEAVRVPCGEFRARHFARTVKGGDSSEWWLHPQLGLPVRGRANGLEYVLTSLELQPSTR